MLDRSPSLFDLWSRRRGLLQSLDPRLKLAATLACLIWISWSDRPWIPAAAIVLTAVMGRLPVFALALRATIVLPFTLFFALMSAWMGDPARAWMLLAKSYLSAFTVAVLMASTPLESLLEAASRFGAPALLTEVIHFTWRYLGVIGTQARRLRTAALSRGAHRSFRVSAQSLAVLFASSYDRAGRIHRAMLARGAAGVRR